MHITISFRKPSKPARLHLHISAYICTLTLVRFQAVIVRLPGAVDYHVGVFLDVHARGAYSAPRIRRVRLELYKHRVCSVIEYFHVTLSQQHFLPRLLDV